MVEIDAARCSSPTVREGVTFRLMKESLTRCAVSRPTRVRSAVIKLFGWLNTVPEYQVIVGKTLILKPEVHALSYSRATSPLRYDLAHFRNYRVRKLISTRRAADVARADFARFENLQHCTLDLIGGGTLADMLKHQNR